MDTQVSRDPSAKGAYEDTTQPSLLENASSLSAVAAMSLELLSRSDLHALGIRASIDLHAPGVT